MSTKGPGDLKQQRGERYIAFRRFVFCVDYVLRARRHVDALHNPHAAVSEQPFMSSFVFCFLFFGDVRCQISLLLPELSIMYPSPFLFCYRRESGECFRVFSALYHCDHGLGFGVVYKLMGEFNQSSYQSIDQSISFAVSISHCSEPLLHY